MRKLAPFFSVLFFLATTSFQLSATFSVNPIPGIDLSCELPSTVELSNQDLYLELNDSIPLPNCNRVTCFDGKGIYTYNDGSIYVGDFRNGIPEGQGVLRYAKGGRYEGMWKHNAPHGMGVMNWLDGRKIRGIWQYGQLTKEIPFEQKPEVQTTQSTPDGPPVKIWAVIVGAANYTAMPSLRFSDDDAYQFFSFLKSPEGGAVPNEQIELLIDENATRRNILDAIRKVARKAGKGDAIFFYFSGHGLPDAFLPTDYNGYTNKLYPEEINDLLQYSKASYKLMFADACHSGGSVLAMKSAQDQMIEKFYSAFRISKGGTAILLSSKWEEYSMEDGGMRSGVFSHYLIAGLNGKADRNGDKIITISELFEYVHKNVVDYTRHSQTPILTGNFDGRLPVAVVRE